MLMHENVVVCVSGTFIYVRPNAPSSHIRAGTLQGHVSGHGLQQGMLEAMGGRVRQGSL